MPAYYQLPRWSDSAVHHNRPLLRQGASCIGREGLSWIYSDFRPGVAALWLMWLLFSEQFEIFLEQKQPIAPPTGHFDQDAMLYQIIDQRCGGVGRGREQ